MTDDEKLLVSMWGEDEADAELSELDVAAMLFVLGREHRRAVLARRYSCTRSSLAGTSRSSSTRQ